MSDVSWLEAASFAFPERAAPVALPNERSGTSPGPLTVAGPRRHHTGFRVGPPAFELCGNGYRRGIEWARERAGPLVVSPRTVRYSRRMDSFARILVVAGLVSVALGLVLMFAGPSLSFLGRLPGDLRVERPGFRLYVPITSSLLVSAILSLVFWVISRLR